jgi:hypothetical protein
MARRNRKRQTVDGFLLPTPVTTVVVVVSTLALSYIWLGCQGETVGKSIKAQEAEQMILKQQLSNEAARWSEMKSMRNLESALRSRSIAMRSPRTDQVVQLSGRFYDGWLSTSRDTGKLAKLERQGLYD